MAGSKFSQTRRLIVLGAAGGAALIAARRLVSVDDGEVVQLTGTSMGTSYMVKLAERLTISRSQELAQAVDAAFADVDRRMSIFRADSEISRFNVASDGAALSASSLAVLTMAQKVSRWSDGAFDVTVAPLVQRWGFGSARRSDIPSAGQLQALREAVDWRGLRLDLAASSATKARPELQVDLGGIAKGYGVDRAAAALEERGVQNYMVELGGEVRTAGINAAGNPWQIGIEEPDAAQRRPRHIVGLRGQSMATSGDYRIYFERDGQRYSHEINPATGAPIGRGIASVTVIAGDCMQADALATALIVMGPRQGFARAEASGVAAQFVLREPNGTLQDAATSAFAALSARSV